MNQELKDKRINDLIALFTKGQIDKCIRQGKKVLKMYPNEPFLFNILGITHAAKGLFAESLNYYEKAIDLNPSYFEVFNNMGVAYNDWKKPKEAISCLKKAIGIQPSYAEAFNNMGNSYKELSDFDNAVISYKKAIDLAPTYTDALCNLGICWSLQEKYEQAEAAYKKALEIDPGNIEIYDYLINNLLERKLYSDAKEVILGLIDNMSYFKGDDGREYKIFGESGVEKTAKEFNKNFLGHLPIHQDLSNSADIGNPLTHSDPNHEVSIIFKNIAEKIKQSFL